MTMPWNQPSTAAGPQPGWYWDPSGYSQFRWWDGTQWTSHVTTEPGYPVAPAEPEPPSQPAPPYPPDGGWQPRTHDPVAARTEPGPVTPMGTELWIEEPSAPAVVEGSDAGVGARRSGRSRRWVITAGAVVVGIIVAALTPGVLGHVLALIVWGSAAWICLRPARSRMKSTARTWARIGVATFAVFAVYAGSLAVVGHSASSGNSNNSARPAGGVEPHCYYSVEDMLGGNPFTVAILGASDCTSYAVGNSEFLVEGVNVPKGAGNAICMGEDGGLTGTVITTTDNYAAGEAYCQSAGWTDLPGGS
jgi:hypothetical protein